MELTVYEDKAVRDTFYNYKRENPDSSFMDSVKFFNDEFGWFTTIYLKPALRGFEAAKVEMQSA